jgi:hypothetical protein
VLHALKGFMSRYPLTRGIAYSYIPYYLAPKNGFLDKMSKKEIIEWERMVTFDALTPSGVTDESMIPLQRVTVLYDHTALQYIATRILAEFTGVTGWIKTLDPKMVFLPGDAEMAVSVRHGDLHDAAPALDQDLLVVEIVRCCADKADQRGKHQGGAPLFEKTAH